MPSGSALAQAVAILLEDEEAESTVNVDLAISLRVCDVDRTGTKPRFIEATDEELIELGGEWNRRDRSWGEYKSETLMIARIPRGGEQEPAARWVAEWLRRAALGQRGKHWDDFRRVWTLLLEGGRRGGKSWLACFSLVAFAITVPNSLVWAVSPTQDETDELEQAIRALMPSDWYAFRGGGAGKPLQFKIANGSRILCLSGFKPRSLKRGRVDLALYNEGQNMYRAGWTQLRGAVSDTGGLVIVAANPPDAEIGRWIEDLHEKTRARKIKAEMFKMTAATNPFVEVSSLEDMADEVDDLTYRREVLGEFVPIGDTVMHAWSDSDSVLEPPSHLIDVTPEFSKKVLGKSFGYVTGVDFQLTPHMASAVFRFFRDPTGPEPEEVIAWVVDEVVVADADENDLLDALESLDRWQVGGRVEGDAYRGWIEAGDDKDKPVHCGQVVDASAFWQDGAHTKGRQSDRVLAARRWAFNYRPRFEVDKKNNPEISERVKTTNARLKSASGRRRMFVAPHCVRVIRAMRSWENRNGIPSRRSDFAHICDAVSYVIYRFFGKPKVKRGPVEYRSVGSFDRGDLYPR